MKYCLRYTNITTKLAKADEITIKYISDKGLIKFIEKYNTQRINLLVDPAQFEDIEIKKLAAIRSTYPDYKFAVALAAFNKELIQKLKASNIPFYIATPCKNWEEFHILIKEGVSDINLSGPLAFELSKVKRVLESLDQKPQIRVTPNKVENLNPNMNSLVGFFIRPEDVVLYEDYIDVLDFEGIDMQDIFFGIYAERKRFIGRLNQCVYGIKEDVDNGGLIQLFGERRINCGRQCLEGGSCNRCFNLAELSVPMGSRFRNHILNVINEEIAKEESNKE